MKIRHICIFAEKIKSCLDQLDCDLITGVSDCALSKDLYLDLLESLRTEIWENSQSLDGLFLQYSYFIQHFVTIKQKLSRCRTTIYALRSNLNKVNDPNALRSYSEELSFLSYIEDQLKFLLSEMRGTLKISLSHRMSIEQNRMIATLEDLFKIEEDYENIIRYLVAKGKINTANEWIDKSRGYKLEVMSLFHLLFEKGFFKVKEYDASFMQQVIWNTYNVDISAKTILSAKYKNNSIFKDLPASITSEIA